MLQPIDRPLVRLRPATLADAPFLYAIRNDPQTRAASRNSKELSYADHYHWFNLSLSNPTRRIFIAEFVTESGEMAIGSGRFDRVNGSEVLSWTIAPDQRGKGYGTALVAALADFDKGKLIAYIKEDNVASRRVAEAAGLLLSGEKDGICQYVRIPL
jgi:RimJ/RimL family protein N-acetyltransferase